MSKPWIWSIAAAASLAAALCTGSAEAKNVAGDPSVATTTVLTSSPNPSIVGDPVTFTATVTPVGGSATPTGSVTFVDLTSSTTLGTVMLDGSGTGDLVTSALTVGTHTVQATYNPNVPWTGSSGTVTQVVNQVPTVTAIVSSLNPSLVGQAVTFTATVSNSGPGPLPTGLVTFVDATAGATLGAVAIDGSGQADLLTSALPAGSRTITATYTPASPTHVGSSDSLTQQVDESSTTTTTTTASTTTTTSSTTTTTTPATSTTPTSGVTTDPVDTTEPPPTITPPTTEPPSQPTASVAVREIAAGQAQTGFGGGFLPGEVVTGEQHSTPLSLGTQVAGVDGTVSFTWTIRPDESAGEHTFVITGSESGSASATFRVVPAGNLPATGAGSEALILAALATLAGGGLLLIRSRRAT